MKLTGMALIGLAGAALITVPAAADRMVVQRTVVHHDDNHWHGHGWHNRGWNHHRTCSTHWYHHRRVTRCY